MFKSEFPDSRVSDGSLWALLRKKRIKYKAVTQKSNNWNIPQEESKDKLKEVRSELLLLDAQGVEIFQIDECVFNGEGFKKKAWSPKGYNIAVELVSKQRKSFKVIGAISSKGTYIYWVSPDYYKAPDIVAFLKFMQRETEGRPIAIFWDNCRTHHARKVT